VQEYEPGWAGATTGNCQQGSAAFPLQSGLIPDFNLQPDPAGNRGSLFSKGFRVKVIRGEIDQTAGEVHAIGNKFSAVDNFHRGSEPDGGREWVLAFLGTVEVLADHADGSASNGLFKLLVGPAALRKKTDALPRATGQLPGCRCRCPIEQACIEFGGSSHPNDKQLLAG
jgi:hypothetical protein